MSICESLLQFEFRSMKFENSEIPNDVIFEKTYAVVFCNSKVSVEQAEILSQVTADYNEFQS
jgi:hypothetical protein